MSEQKTMQLEKDGLCGCGAADTCPLGKTGASLRCTPGELASVGVIPIPWSDKQKESEYRELGPNERIELRDEYWTKGEKWRPTCSVGLTPSKGMRYRRRVDQPDYTGTIGGGFSDTVGPPTDDVISGPPYATVEGGHDAQIDVDAAFREAGVDPSRCVDNVTQAGLDASEAGCHIESPGVLAKPPLGCKPRFIWVEHRVGELSDAIGRYADDSARMPVEWVIELQEHLTWLKERGDESQGNPERHD